MPYISVIIPALNEEENIHNLLDSLKRQDFHDFETIVVDGGSKDRTVAMSQEYGAVTMVLPKMKEFPSRNKAAEAASGDILLFTGADVIFPDNLLGNLARKFEKSELLAVAGPGIPYDTSIIYKLEFFIYNCARCFFAHLPRPFKRFSTSTNLLAVRKNVFHEVGGLDPNEFNADGMLGRKLCDKGPVWFSFFKVKAYASARRIKSMGGLEFNRHFVYVLENFFPFLSSTPLVRNAKCKSSSNHSDMRVFIPEPVFAEARSTVLT